MTRNEQAIAKIMKNRVLKEYDVINLEYIGFYLTNNINIVKHGEVPTLMTHCNVAVVISE